MREQIGNKDLREKLDELEHAGKSKDSEIKNLKKQISEPDVFSAAMYMTRIDELRHRVRRLEGGNDAT